jgi:hypothetical protein
MSQAGHSVPLSVDKAELVSLALGLTLWGKYSKMCALDHFFLTILSRGFATDVWRHDLHAVSKILLFLRQLDQADSSFSAIHLQHYSERSHSVLPFILLCN